MKILLTIAAALLSGLSVRAQEPKTESVEKDPPPIQINGAFPSISVIAGQRERSEAGIGALLPWANRLWLISYIAHTRGEDERLGLFYLDEEMRMHKHPASVVGTFANRYIHNPSDQAFIGPYAIDAKGNVRTANGAK
jgi:hypothetical protein